MKPERESICFDRIADRYEETRGGMERGKRFASYLWPHLRTSRPVLEIGVGSGVVASTGRLVRRCGHR